jgi:hypothetical protein
MKELGKVTKSNRGPQRDILWTASEVMPIQKYLPEIPTAKDTGDYGPTSLSGDEWVVTYIEKRGRKKPKECFLVCESEEEASDFFNLIINERLAYDRSPNASIPQFVIEDIQDLLDSKMVSKSMQFRTEMQDDLPRRVLEGDGIIDSEGNTSEEVLQLLGIERTEYLKDRHGYEWRVVAEMEYVMRERSRESVSYLAAGIRYHLFIEKNPLLVGYFLNELEYLARGEERRILQAFLTDKKAGDGGGNKQTSSMLARIESIMDELHRLRTKTVRGAFYPKERLINQAVENVSARNPTLWRRGKPQVPEYLIWLKEGKLGVDQQNRYFDVFPSERIENADIYQKKLKVNG